jgi:excisionase family DNA binding protein
MELKTPEQVAEYLGVALTSVHKFVRQGRLGCIQIDGKNRRFTDEQIQEFLNRNTIPASVDFVPVSAVKSYVSQPQESPRALTRSERLKELRGCR